MRNEFLYSHSSRIENSLKHALSSLINRRPKLINSLLLLYFGKLYFFNDNLVFQNVNKKRVLSFHKTLFYCTNVAFPGVRTVLLLQPCLHPSVFVAVILKQCSGFLRNVIFAQNILNDFLHLGRSLPLLKMVKILLRHLKVLVDVIFVCNHVF